MNVLLNILWVLLGGWVIALYYFCTGIFMMITIIGFPYGVRIMQLLTTVLWPFGTDIPEGRWPSGCYGSFMTVVWWFVGGLYITLIHLISGALLCLTIIGIPFGLQHFRLMKMAVLPFGDKNKADNTDYPDYPPYPYQCPPADRD